MRIGIDLRMAGTGEGIARYCEELVRHLSNIDFDNDYFLLLPDRANVKFKVQNAKFRNVTVKSPYYSWQEQTRFIRELKKLELDLVHFPNFNVPIFYPGKFIITIHDIIHHQFPGKKKSRLFHRLAYRMVIEQALKQANKVIAVSENTKNDVAELFRVPREKIIVIYEGVDESFFNKLTIKQINKIKLKYNITKPYLLFVGVWRQYKNLQRLALAFDKLKAHGLEYQLVLAGKIDPYYPEIKSQVLRIKNQGDVRVLGFVPDEDLVSLYQGAKVFVLPSLVEGFGLIAVEAQAAGVPVAASDISVLREVLGRSAFYFNPESEQDMAEKIGQVLSDKNLATRLEEQGRANAKKYNWQTTAQETLKIYLETPRQARGRT